MSVIQVTFFVTRDVAMFTTGLRNKLVAKANVFLRPHRMKLDVFPWGPEDPIEVDFEGALPKTGWRPPPWDSDAAGIAARKRLRQAAHTAYPADDGRLKVIFCKIQGGGAEAPGSLGEPKGAFPPYVLISDETKHPDGLTLVHEIGHCAGLPHAAEDDIDNIMGYGLERTIILADQVAALRNASFHAAMAAR